MLDTVRCDLRLAAHPDSAGDVIAERTGHGEAGHWVVRQPDTRWANWLALLVSERLESAFGFQDPGGFGLHIRIVICR